MGAAVVWRGLINRDFKRRCAEFQWCLKVLLKDRPEERREEKGRRARYNELSKHTASTPQPFGFQLESMCSRISPAINTERCRAQTNLQLSEHQGYWIQLRHQTTSFLSPKQEFTFKTWVYMGQPIKTKYRLRKTENSKCSVKMNVLGRARLLESKLST